MTEYEVERLVVRLVGDVDQYKRSLQQATKETENAERNIGRSLQSIGGSLKSIGTSLSLKLTAPIVAMGAASVRAFAGFDQAMTESTSIMSVTESQIESMRKQALSLSGEATQGPEEMARSYFFLASAGKDAEQSMALLPQVAKFATAGAFDMALATDLLTDAQSALGLTSKDTAEDVAGLTRVADVLVKANTLANASVQQFSESLTNTAGATMKAFSKDVEEGVAVLAAYADQGIKGAVAGTNFSRVNLLLSKSARDNAKAHKELGFTVFDANGKMRNYADIIQNLEQITAGMSDEVKSATLEQLGFEARIQQAVLPLLGSSDAIRRYERELRNAKGTVEEVANKQMKSFTNQMKILWNRVKAVAIEIGQILVPMIEKLSEYLKVGLQWWKGLDQSTKEWIVTVGILAAAIGPVLVTLGVLTASVGSIISFVGILTPMVSSLSTAFMLMVPNSALGALVTLKGHLAAALSGISLLKIGAIGFGAYLAARWITDLIVGGDAVDEFNESLIESNELLEKWIELKNKQTAGLGDQVNALPKSDQQSFIKDQIEATEKAIAEAQDRLKRAKIEVTYAKGRTTDIASLFGLDSEVQEAKQNVKELKTSIELQKNKLSELQRLASSKTEGAAKNLPLPGLEKAGTDGASLVEDEAKRAKALAEQFMDPMEKFDKSLDDLERIFDKGLIDEGVFERAKASIVEDIARSISDPEFEKQSAEAEKRKEEIKVLEAQFASPEKKFKQEAERIQKLMEEGLDPAVAQKHLESFAKGLSPTDSATVERFVPSVSVEASVVGSVAGRARALEALSLAGPQMVEKEPQKFESSQLVTTNDVLTQIKDLTQLLVDKENPTGDLQPAGLEG